MPLSSKNSEILLGIPYNSINSCSLYGKKLPCEAQFGLQLKKLLHC